MKTVLIILSVFLFTSCNSDDDNNAPAQSTPVDFIEIGRDALFGAGIEGIPQSNMVIDNTTDWQNLMTQMDSFRTPTSQFLETNVDFNSYLVIAIFLEVKSTAWEVEITNIVENETNITVSSIDGGGFLAIVSQPFHIVKIPITDKPILFE